MPCFTQTPTPFGHSLTGDCLFSVNAGIPIKLALELAAQLLSSATVLCAESQVASPQTSHSLTYCRPTPSNKHLYRHFKVICQPANLPHVELTLAAEDFGYHRLRAHARQITLVQPMLLHH